MATRHNFTVSDPLFRPVAVSIVLSDKDTAYIEMAAASGLQLLKRDEYNASATSTYGTGELIKHAITLGASKIVLGLGGSATNDCGIGMASALGYRFLDQAGKELKPIGSNLNRIQAIDASNAMNTKNLIIQAACDVTNPLVGEYGATYTYGPQKGASTQMLEGLEMGMISFAERIRCDLGIDVTAIKGGGAAGGMGAGCVAFLSAELVSGIELMFELFNIEKHILEADLIITGEGKLDVQTLHGKLISGIAQLGHKHNKPVVGMCGTLALDHQQVMDLKLTAAFSIINRPMTLEEASREAFVLLSDTAYQVGRTLIADRIAKWDVQIVPVQS
jgi:glycerate kinase